MSEAIAVLNEVFAYPAFRAGQAAAVEAVLAGRDAAVLLPTGGGKSLCYQVPAIVLARAGRGTTLVISPLLALMKDQVEALVGRGIEAAALNSQQDDDTQREVIARLLAGELALLYVSPERAVQAGFKRLLARTTIAALAIDEAHCLSQWGHDFRPEYLRLSELRALPELASVPTLVLTATATPRVMDEISRVMALRDPVSVRGDFARPNLAFSVRQIRTDSARIQAIQDACDAEGLRSRVGAGRAIVYCSTRKKAETVAAALKAAGFAAAHYHAGRTTLARDRAQRSFALGRTRVLVATSAFGMGIDYPDVRLLVHFQTPGSLEAYYQEAGRAGRDGMPAKCLMLFGPGDLATQRRLAQGESARAEQALEAIERYAESSACRQVFLCAHFTGTEEHASCGTCDVCTHSVDVDHDGKAAENATAIEVAGLGSEVRDTVLAAAAAMARPAGKTNLAKALRGSKAKTVAVSGLLLLPQAGALAHVSEAALIALIDALIAERKLVRRGRKYPTVWLHGRDEDEAVRARAPRTRAKASSSPAARRPRSNELVRALERFRNTTARRLKWKPYMVFQQRVITAIEEQKPSTASDLERIPGLGHAKIERFGAELLELVRRHS